MASTDKKTSPDEETVQPANIVPSALDAHTHIEMRALYEESTKTLRFIKSHQWKTVGATMLTFFGLIFIAGFIHAGAAITQKFMGITIVLTVAVIFTLVIYQFWMHNEQRKIEMMNEHMSSLFREVRAIKSQMEGNLHRYTLLTFMILTVFLGAVVVNIALDKIALS